MHNLSLIHLLEYVGHDLSPVWAVIAFFTFGYVIVAWLSTSAKAPRHATSGAPPPV